MAATVYKRLHNASIGGGSAAGIGSSLLSSVSSGSSPSGSAAAGGAGASPMLGHSQLTRSLERILEEAHFSGELILTNRKLKDFPKMGAKYSLEDTVIAGEWIQGAPGRGKSRILCGSFLLFAAKINNLQQPVACCAALSLSPSHTLSLFFFLLTSLSSSHAPYALHVFRSLPPPCFSCLPKDNNYCSCFFIIIFLFFFLLFRVLHYFIFLLGFPSAPFQVQPTFVFVVLPKMQSDTNTHTHRHIHVYSYTLSGTLLVTHPPTDNHPDEEENHLFSQTPRIDFQLRPVQLSFFSFPFPFSFTFTICHRTEELST